MAQEGVSKFHLDWQEDPVIDCPDRCLLSHWRDVLHAHGLIGADPARYGGIGFGNVSCRCDSGFLITATQTGHLATLAPDHFCQVTRWDIVRNQLWAEGPQPPSSEALSHAACYDAHPEILWVFHIHHPLLWQQAAVLGLPATPLDAEYGTPAMALAVSHLAGQGRLPLLIRMAGHEDGLIAAGHSAAATGAVLLNAVAEAQASSALRR
ncbi:MAG: class II aldolase/adducin family protein [Acidithiobacillus sp.]